MDEGRMRRWFLALAEKEEATHAHREVMLGRMREITGDPGLRPTLMRAVMESMAHEGVLREFLVREGRGVKKCYQVIVAQDQTDALNELDPDFKTEIQRRLS